MDFKFVRVDGRECVFFFEGGIFFEGFIYFLEFDWVIDVGLYLIKIGLLCFWL